MTEHLQELSHAELVKHAKNIEEENAELLLKVATLQQATDDMTKLTLFYREKIAGVLDEAISARENKRACAGLGRIIKVIEKLGIKRKPLTEHKF